MYTFKEMILKNKSHQKKRLIIEFENPDKAILAQFLMTEVAQNGQEFLQRIQALQNGDTPIVEGAGNIFAWKITNDIAIIEDLFVDEIAETPYPSYEITTSELKALVTIWTNKFAAWQQGEQV